MQIQESNTYTESFPGSHLSQLCKWPQAAAVADTYHSRFLRFDVPPKTEQHLVQTASFDHTEITTEAANVIKSEKEGETLKGDMFQPEKRLPIGKGQTTVEDRLQLSLRDPSMFNAVGQRKGRAGPATHTEEVISGVDWLEGERSDFKGFDRRQESVTQSVS